MLLLLFLLLIRHIAIRSAKKHIVRVVHDNEEKKSVMFWLSWHPSPVFTSVLYTSSLLMLCLGTGHCSCSTGIWRNNKFLLDCQQYSCFEQKDLFLVDPLDEFVSIFEHKSLLWEMRKNGLTLWLHCSKYSVQLFIP